jgi:hypothetical protein
MTARAQSKWQLWVANNSFRAMNSYIAMTGMGREATVNQKLANVRYAFTAAVRNQSQIQDTQND